MRKSLFTITFLCLFALPAYAKQVILVVGDSLSAGYGINPQQGWVSLLQQRLQQEKLPYEVINDSISGDTTSNGLVRLPNALQQHKPQITIIELGGNDGLRGLPITVIKQNLKDMIKLAKINHSQVLLLGVRLPPNYGPAYTTQFQAIYSDLAKQFSIPVVGLFLHNIDDKPNLMQADNIHPTTAAQPLLLNNVWQTLSLLLTSSKS